MSVPDSTTTENWEFLKMTSDRDFPTWATREELVQFFHHTMKPYQDTEADVQKALDHAFTGGPNGFVMLLKTAGSLGGALVMLDTGMKGYIPENILLFVSISPSLRGQGFGQKLIQHCLDECPGEVKLHVEYENPAKRLYERIGFTSKYAEMRITK
jgi:[ribosomal protein S18]-alanine N-acetyltransferase